MASAFCWSPSMRCSPARLCLAGGREMEAAGRYRRLWSGLAGLFCWRLAATGTHATPPKPQPTATAVLVQPNLDVAADNSWTGPGEWDSHIADFTRLAGEQCKTYIAGIPQTGAPTGEIVCPPYPTHPDLVVWPESPAPFVEADPRFQQIDRRIGPVDAGAAGRGRHRHRILVRPQAWQDYNSAMIFAPDGKPRRPLRQDPPRSLRRVHSLSESALLRPQAHRPGQRRSRAEPTRQVFLLPTQNGARHRYGVFICYEAVFADEVRQFRAQRRRGAGQHQRRRLVRRHQRPLAAPEHGAHAGHRKPPLDSARHQQRRHRGHRPLRPRAPEHSPPPGRCAARRVRLPQRHHLLHRARRRLRVVLCHTFNRRCRLVGEQTQPVLPAAPEPKSKSGPKSKWH